MAFSSADICGGAPAFFSCQRRPPAARDQQHRQQHAIRLIDSSFVTTRDAGDARCDPFSCAMEEVYTPGKGCAMRLGAGTGRRGVVRARLRRLFEPARLPLLTGELRRLGTL
jgi:hypothetical protein